MILWQALRTCICIEFTIKPFITETASLYDSTVVGHASAADLQCQKCAMLVGAMLITAV
jgi:hypothetical protein